MNRKRRITLIALGAAVSLLLGSGLLALASDSVVSEDNSISSATFAVPSHNMKAARVASGTQCATAAYTDGPFTALISGTITLGQAGLSTLGQEDVFCLRNDGSAAGQIVMSFQNAVDQEIGACEATESEAGDTTCGDGDSGELKGLLAGGASLNAEGTTSNSCLGSGNNESFSVLETTPDVIDADIWPGEICVIQLHVGANLGLANESYLRAQTDRVQWDVVFTLLDVTP